MAAQPNIEQHLKTTGRIDAWQIRSAEGYQRRWGRSFEQAIVELGFMTVHDVLLETAQFMGVPYIRIDSRAITRDAIRSLPEKLIRARKVMPLAITGDPRRGSLVVAMTNPRDLAALDEIRFAARIAVQPVLASESEIDQAIGAHFGKAPQEPETRGAA